MFKKKICYVLFSILLISSRLFGAAAPSQPDHAVKRLLPGQVHSLSPSVAELSSILKLHQYKDRLLVEGFLYGPYLYGTQERRQQGDAVFIDLKTRTVIGRVKDVVWCYKLIPGINVIAERNNRSRKLRIITNSSGGDQRYKVLDGDPTLCAYSNGDGQRKALFAVGANDEDPSTVTLFKYDDLKLHTKATTLPKQAKDNAKIIPIDGCKINDVVFSDNGEQLVVCADNYGASSTSGAVSGLLLYKINVTDEKATIFDFGLRVSRQSEKNMYPTENNNTIFIHTYDKPSGGYEKNNVLYECSCNTGACKVLLCLDSEKNIFYTDNVGMKKAAEVLNAYIPKKGFKVCRLGVTPNKTGSLIALTINDYTKHRVFLALLGKYFGKKKNGYRVIGTFDHNHMILGDHLSVAFDDEEAKLYLTGFGQGNIAVFDGIVNNEIPLLQKLCAACIRENQIDSSLLPKLIQERFALHVVSSSRKRSGSEIKQQNPKKQRLP